jgi:calcium/proton exchanger cax
MTRGQPSSATLATFVVAAIALAGLAWVVGVGTESIGAHLGPAATGVLQSTLGNLPELFIVLFALRAGELVVAQTSVLGSLFGNGLLPGLRARRGHAAFGRVPGSSLLLAVLALLCWLADVCEGVAEVVLGDLLSELDSCLAGEAVMDAAPEPCVDDLGT